METLADSVLDHLTVSTDTITENVSPRKPDLVGLLDITSLLAEMGKVNQETGEPLTNARVASLLNRSDFPNPAYGSVERSNRLWWRKDVVEWAKKWDQKQGYPRGRPRPRWIRVESSRLNNKLTRVFKAAHDGRPPYEDEQMQAEGAWHRFKMNDAGEEWWERQTPQPWTPSSDA